jgi:hypothetical protein
MAAAIPRRKAITIRSSGIRAGSPARLKTGDGRGAFLLSAPRRPGGFNPHPSPRLPGFIESRGRRGRHERRHRRRWEYGVRLAPEAALPAA